MKRGSRGSENWLQRLSRLQTEGAIRRAELRQTLEQSKRLRQLIPPQETGFPPPRELIEAEAFRMLERVTDGFIALNRTGHIVYLNARARKVLDAIRPARNSLVGRYLWREYPELTDVIGKEIRRYQRLARRRARVPATDVEDLLRLIGRRPDGAEIF